MLLLLLTQLDSEAEKDKFTKLYLMYRGVMKYTALKVLYDEYLAEDAVQMAFERVLKNLDKIHEIDSHQTKLFLVVIVRNISKNLYNEQKKRQTVNIEEVAEQSCDILVDEEFINQIDYKELLAAIDQLSQDHKDILYLKYLHGLLTKEISEILDIKLPTAKKDWNVPEMHLLNCSRKRKKKVVIVNKSDTLSPTLLRALQDIENQEIDELVIEEVSFSPEFEKNMQELISRKKEKRSVFRLFRSPFAAAVIVFIIISFTTIISVEALREPFVKFWVSVFERFSITRVEVDETSPEEIEEIYYPQYLPDGYTLSEENDFILIYQQTYSHSDKDDIVLRQYVIGDETEINTEEVALQPIQIGPYEGYVTFYEGETLLFWSDGRYEYLLSGTEQKNELIKIAESIKILN